MKERKYKNYRDDLMKDLKNLKTALNYLNAAYEDEDPNVFLLAIKDVADAWGGMTKLSRTAKIPRITLYRMLSKRGNPGFGILANLLRTLGLKFMIVEEKHSGLKHAA